MPRRQIVLLVAIIISFSLVGQSQAAGRHPHRTVTIHVDSILAADTNEGVDSRLMHVSGRLKALFDYSTYRLISRDNKKTSCGKMVAFTLPGGRILHVAPRKIDNNMIAMELVLFQGERPMMTTDLKLRNHGMLILGGPRYQQGMLIVFMTADSRYVPAPGGGSHAPTTPVSAGH
ncbi:MAG: hypothetical protein ACREP6_09075 [Candidatus Binataceae bacterium]